MNTFNEIIEVGDIIDGRHFTNNTVVSVHDTYYMVTNQGEEARNFPDPFTVTKNVAKLVSKAQHIQVGDTIGSIKYLEGTKGVVVKIEDGKYFIGKKAHEHYTFAQARLISRGTVNNITGYKLLKDLPGLSKGTKSNEYNGRKAFFTNHTFEYPDLNDTTWFEPIYKAKEVVVKISNDRCVVITDNKVTLSNNVLSFHDITKVNNLLNPPVIVASEFKVDIQVISIGCQSFVKEDIRAVYQAIQNFNK